MILKDSTKFPEHFTTYKEFSTIVLWWKTRKSQHKNKRRKCDEQQITTREPTQFRITTKKKIFATFLLPPSCTLCKWNLTIFLLQHVGCNSYETLYVNVKAGKLLFNINYGFLAEKKVKWEYKQIWMGDLGKMLRYGNAKSVPSSYENNNWDSIAVKLPRMASLRSQRSPETCVSFQWARGTPRMCKLILFICKPP